MASLVAWMNGERVGTWTTTRSGKPVFDYAPDWPQSPSARPLSLSLPITSNLDVRGDVVDHYFDNLLPDNPAIRRRLRDRYHLRSIEAFDLLEEVGRDCAGAIQLLPPGRQPDGWNRIDARPLTESEVERHLREISLPHSRTPDGETAGEFRISIAGAQEKTALLRKDGRWHMPLGATPTTHILKLPLGIIGSFRGDFSYSTENEWLCAQILRELGLPVANAEMACFGEQKVLVVERFDRRWMDGDTWIARLPQEDFCQATGRPPTRKYESDGGPTMQEIATLLGASKDAVSDRTHFLLAQLAFWLLAATDGHAKNFSIHLHAGGSFSLAPLYDVLSAWPVIGTGANQLPWQDARLAMAVRGRNAHYRIHEVLPRHWNALALRHGDKSLWLRMQQLVEGASVALDRVAALLPGDFPQQVFEGIASGVRRQVQVFQQAPAGA